MKFQVEILAHHYGQATIFYANRVIDKDADGKGLSKFEAFDAISELSENLSNKVAEGVTIFYLTNKQLTRFFKALNIKL